MLPAAAYEAHVLLACAHLVSNNAHSEATVVVVQCRSRQMFDSHSIQTILKAAGLSVTVRETQRAGHATEIVRSLQLDQCDALITVGGDGTVFEALQVMQPCAHVTTDMQILPTCTTLNTRIVATHKASCIQFKSPTLVPSFYVHDACDVRLHQQLHTDRHSCDQ